MVVFNRCDDCAERAYPLNVYASRDGCEWELDHENQDPFRGVNWPGPLRHPGAHGIQRPALHAAGQGLSAPRSDRGLSQLRPGHGGGAEPFPPVGAGEREQLPPRAGVHPAGFVPGSGLRPQAAVERAVALQGRLAPERERARASSATESVVLPHIDAFGSQYGGALAQLRSVATLQQQQRRRPALITQRPELAPDYVGSLGSGRMEDG